MTKTHENTRTDRLRLKNTDTARQISLGSDLWPRVGDCIYRLLRGSGGDGESRHLGQQCDAMQLIDGSRPAISVF